MTLSERGADWRDLRFTVSVLLARAQVELEAEAAPPASVPAFEFRLLAAAASAEMRLPSEPWHDLEHLLAVSVTPRAGSLRVTLQAEGFAALGSVAGRPARLLARDGSIDLAFRFDAAGRGLAVLEDSPAVRRGLQHFRVRLDGSGG